MLLSLSNLVSCIHYYGSYMIVFCEDGATLLFQSSMEVDLIEMAADYRDLDYIANFIIKKYHIYDASIPDFIQILKQYLQKSSNNRKVFRLCSNCSNANHILITGEKGRLFPSRLQVEITGNCNFHCMHCYKNAAVGLSGFINETDTCQLLNFIKEGIYELAITGGEPLLHPEFQNIAKSFRNKCRRLELNTNGMLLDSLDENILKIFDHVSISLYGLDDSDYYTNVGIRNGFERVKEGCLRLNRANVNFTISILLSREVISKLAMYIETAIKLGASTLKIGVINKIGRAKKHEDNLDMLTDYEIKIAYRKIRLLAKTYVDKISIIEWNREGYRNFGKEIYNNSLFDAPFRCTAGSLQWAVNENFKFRPCVLMPEENALMMNFEQWKDIIMCRHVINWSSYLSNMCDYCTIHGTLPEEYCDQLMLSCNKEGDKKMEISDISRTMKRVGLHQFFYSLIAVPMGIVVARMVARVVTLAITGDVKNTCVTAAVLMGAVIIWRIVTAFAQAALTREKSRAVQECRMSTYRKLLELPLDRLYRNERGQSMEGLTDDLNRFVKRETELVPGLFISIITVASYGVFIAYYSPVTAGLFLLISLLQLLPPVIVKKYMQVNYEDCREIEAKLDGFLLEAYRGFSTVKLYGLTEWMIQKLKALHTDYTRIGYRSTITVHAEDSMETLLQNILRYGTYGLVGYLVLINLTTMEEGIEAITLSSAFYAAVLSAFQAIPEFGTAKVAEGRLSAWLVSDVVENDGTIDTSTAENLLVFDAVSYQYSERYAAISNFSETFEPGVTLVCGANGSGKSTLLKMAIGLLRVQSGIVTMKGIKPEYISPQSFPRDILFLPQEDLKISLSPLQFYEMVEGLSQEDAMQCAFSFGLTREQLEDGQIDQLSTGQRKKVYLAMAFTLGSSVLLLDEPGNGLDAQGEERLLSLLRDRKKTKSEENSRITVVVTHDRLFDEVADYVVVLAERNTEEERT